MKLGPYRIHSELGRGAMGVTYLAAHEALNVPAVIKFSQDPGVNLLEEGRLGARAVSPFVSPVLDAGTSERGSYLVLGYVDGVDLLELLDSVKTRQSGLPVPFVARAVAQVARGLHAIHSAGVVHRDIKPANIFLRSNGDAVLGDFGVALDSVESGGQTISGTPAYMSPEQWSGHSDSRSDVYSLGVVAWQLLTGRLPFRRSGLSQMKRAHLSESPAPPQPSSPEEAYLLEVIRRAMEKDPSDRYQSALHMVRALEALPPSRRASRLPTIQLSRGDIATSSAEVLVNAANHSLKMRRGVAGALKAAAGPEVEVEALSFAPGKMGSVSWTGAGRLPAKSIAHAVAALSGAICVGRCTFRILLGCVEKGHTAVAFPALGTGVGGVPMALSASLTIGAIHTVAAALKHHSPRVEIYSFENSDFETWQRTLAASAKT